MNYAKRLIAVAASALCLSGYAQTSQVKSVGTVEIPFATTNLLMANAVEQARPKTAPAAKSIATVVIPADVVKSDIGSSNTPVAAVAKLPLPKPAARFAPGLGLIPGDITETRVKSIRVGSDRNELIYVSASQLNKITTPFPFPKVVDSTKAPLQTLGQDVFIQPVSDKPFTIYITNDGGGQSVGLTLVPSPNLPAQSYVIEPESTEVKNNVAEKPEDIGPSDYVGRLTQNIKHLALGETPSGFAKTTLPASFASNKQMMFQPLYKYSGSLYDIFSYRVRSVAENPIELNEEAFYTPSVRAVAFFPNVLLQKGQETDVYVIADHSGKDSQ